jgi:hypothetical protein
VVLIAIQTGQKTSILIATQQDQLIDAWYHIRVVKMQLWLVIKNNKFVQKNSNYFLF